MDLHQRSFPWGWLHISICLVSSSLCPQKGHWPLSRNFHFFKVPWVGALLESNLVIPIGSDGGDIFLAASMAEVLMGLQVRSAMPFLFQYSRSAWLSIYVRNRCWILFICRISFQCNCQWVEPTVVGAPGAADFANCFAPSSHSMFSWLARGRWSKFFVASKCPRIHLCFILIAGGSCAVVSCATWIISWWGSLTYICHWSDFFSADCPSQHWSIFPVVILKCLHRASINTFPAVMPAASARKESKSCWLPGILWVSLME